jgi:hypothetical protein
VCQQIGTNALAFGPQPHDLGSRLCPLKLCRVTLGNDYLIGCNL